MGKTTLVLESIRIQEDAVYYRAIRGSAEQQIDSFTSDAAVVRPGATQIREVGILSLAIWQIKM